jgi:hypothetical protein
MKAPPTSFKALFEPCEFDHEDDAFDTVWEFARAHMFAIFKKDVGKPNRKVWGCTKSGVHDRRNKKIELDFLIRQSWCLYINVLLGASGIIFYAAL